MAEVNLLKISSASLVPATEADIEALSHIKTGEIVRCKYTRMRNAKFFRKWWALVGLAYDSWCPEQIQVNGARFVPEKNMDTFRKNLTVLAGYYDVHFTIAGEPRIEAKSISFSNMKEEEFEKLYSATIDVVLKHILKNYTGDELEETVMNIIRFV